MTWLALPVRPYSVGGVVVANRVAAAAVAAAERPRHRSARARRTESFGSFGSDGVEGQWARTMISPVAESPRSDFTAAGGGAGAGGGRRPSSAGLAESPRSVAGAGRPRSGGLTRRRQDLEVAVGRGVGSPLGDILAGGQEVGPSELC